MTVKAFIALVVVVFGIPAVVAAWSLTKRSGRAGVAGRKNGQPVASVHASHPSIATEYDFDEFTTPNQTHEFLERIARGETI